MRQGKRLFLLTTVALLLIVLCGCNLTDSPDKPSMSSKTYTLQFMVGDIVYSAQTVREGVAPTPVLPEGDGMVFVGWLDEDGQTVKPETISVTKDMTYYARVYPDLNSHAAYLFEDEAGLLQPEKEITKDTLQKAVKALATGAAAYYLPELPAGEEALDTEALTVVLKDLFPVAEVENAVAQIKGEIPKRGEFAVVMNTLLARDKNSGATLAKEAEIPVDLPEDSLYFTPMMEASLPHSHTEQDVSWEELALFQNLSTGFFNRNGYLYYLNADKTLARNTKIGSLQFDANGRFTSSDPELDALVAGVLDTIIKENPNLTGLDLLRKAYEYSRDSFSYLRRNAYTFGQTGWEIEDAKKMMTTKRGNCYNFAATFWALARGLGYEAKAISGIFLTNRQSHSWVEIEIEGVPYIFDPQEEWAYRNKYEPKDFTKDMFMLTYAQGAWWSYDRP